MVPMILFFFLLIFGCIEPKLVETQEQVFSQKEVEGKDYFFLPRPENSTRIYYLEENGSIIVIYFANIKEDVLPNLLAKGFTLKEIKEEKLEVPNYGEVNATLYVAEGERGEVRLYEGEGKDGYFYAYYFEERKEESNEGKTSYEEKGGEESSTEKSYVPFSGNMEINEVLSLLELELKDLIENQTGKLSLTEAMKYGNRAFMIKYASNRIVSQENIDAFVEDVRGKNYSIAKVYTPREERVVVIQKIFGNHLYTFAVDFFLNTKAVYIFVIVE